MFPIQVETLEIAVLKKGKVRLRFACPDCTYAQCMSIRLPCAGGGVVGQITAGGPPVNPMLQNAKYYEYMSKLPPNELGPE